MLKATEPASTGRAAATRLLTDTLPPRLALMAMIAVLTLPLLFGMLGVILPAFGYFPALGGHEVGLAHFSDLAAVPGLARSALLSLFSGLGATSLSVLTVVLFLAAFAGTSVLRRVQHFLSPLLAIPHAAAAFGLAFLFAPSGFLIRLVAPVLGIDRPPDLLVPHDPLGLALVAGLVVKEIPFLFLVALAALPQVDLSATRQLAASLGYGRIAGFLFLLWPGIYRQIRFAVYAVVAYSSSVVDVAVILGPTMPGTLATRLLEWMSDPDLAARFRASAGALLQFGVTIVALLLWHAAERVGRVALIAARDRGARCRRDRGLHWFAAGTVICASAIVFGGIAVLALWSVAGLWQYPEVTPNSYTLKTWIDVLPRTVGPLWTTVTVGLAAALIALLLTVGCLERETQGGKEAGGWAPFLLYLPLIVPQITFVFGLQLLFLASGTTYRLSALVLVHLVFALPYVFLSLSDPWRALDTRYDSIATALGRSRLASLLVVRLPMLTRAILTAAAVGFAVSVGQYLPTVLIGEGRLATITTEAVALASGGNRRLIGIYALLQATLPFVAFLLASLVPALLFRNRRAMRV